MLSLSDIGVMIRLPGCLALCGVVFGLRASAAEAAPRPAGLDWTREIRGAWFSYGLNITREEAAEAGRKLAQNGYNTVILTGYHYRFSHIEEWPKLVEAIGHISDGMHEAGVRVFEHHSVLALIADRIDDPCRGTTFREMAQKDPKGQAILIPSYSAYWLCPNHPAVQKAYAEHVTDLFQKTSIDGLMSDDIEFLENSTVCCCPHCTALFEKKAGVKLAPFLSSPDRPFFGNLDSTDFRKWIRFRQECVGDHYERIRSLLNRIRPEAPLFGCLSVMASAPIQREWAFTVEQMARGSDLLFFEAWGNVNLSHQHNWYEDIAEAAIAQSVARPKGMPVLVLKYTVNPDERYFAWAVDKAFGIRLWSSEPDNPGGCISWEARRADLFSSADRPARVAVLYSKQTRNHRGQAGFTDEYMGWCERLLRANVPFRVIRDEDVSAEGLKGFTSLVLPAASCLSDSQCRAVRAFTGSGRRLVMTGNVAEFDELGERRKEPGLKDLPATRNPAITAAPDFPGASGRSRFEQAGSSPEDKGKFVVKGTDRPDKTAWVDDMISKLAADAPLKVIEALPGLIATLMVQQDGTRLVHLVNGSGALADPGTKVAHHAATFPEMKGAITLQIEGPDGAARGFTTENDEGIALSPVKDGKLSLPASLVGRYMVVKITPHKTGTKPKN